MDPRAFRWRKEIVLGALQEVAETQAGRIVLHDLIAESGMYEPYISTNNEPELFTLGQRAMGQYIFNALRGTTDTLNLLRLAEDEARDEQRRLFDEKNNKGNNEQTLTASREEH